MKAKKQRLRGVVHFYFRVDQDSVPPPRVEVGVMLFFLSLVTMGMYSLLLSANFLGIAILALLIPILFAIPGRLYIAPEGFEKRSLFVRRRRFNGRKKTLWGRRCTWSDVTRFDEKKTAYRGWLRDLVGDRKQVIRAKGMPVMEVHSLHPSYHQVLQSAAEKLSPKVFTRHK